MPVVEATAVVPIPRELAFAVSQTTAPVRYRWDPFVRKQYFIDGAARPAKGVRTFTRSRHGLTMVSEYVSFAPPNHVGMKMVRGPRFFEMFAGGWRFKAAADPGYTLVTWRYSFRCKPAMVRPLGHWIGKRLLQRDIERRIAGYVEGCHDPVVISAARQAIAGHDD